MSGLTSETPIPVEITLHQHSRKLELTYLEDGGSIRDARRFHIQRIRYDGNLKGWVYYD